ncbi:MAG: Fe-S protein assembly chaperone HscA [Pseudomonadota bacterium]
MALFQISEPDAPALERVIGIDLGTTHSLVGVVENGIAKVLLDEKGEALLPSAVYVSENKEITVGIAARNHPLSFTSFKRWIGRSTLNADDPATLKLNNGQLAVETPLGLLTAIDLSAYILLELKQRAETYFGDSVQGAIITVPAYFDEAQRQATKKAAEQAGLNVLRLLNEPTAAAIAYGLDDNLTGTYAIYDLGGGTFDVSILKLHAGVFEVLATSGNIALGGDDFDRVLAEHVLPDLAEKGLSQAALRAMRPIKEALSERKRVSAGISLQVGKPFTRIVVEAAQFHQWTRPLIEKTFSHIQRALKDAGLERENLDGVVLVGGATRMPHLRAAVERFFGRRPLLNLNPDQIVALGAARQAFQLIQEEQDWLLLDVTPLSLGIETMGGLVEKIIPRNTTLPVSRIQEFTTFQDGQTALKLHVLQGEREAVKDCRSLAHFILKGIPPMPAGMARIRVTFQIDADGLLAVSAKELSQGIEASITIRPSEGLETDEIEQRLQDATKHAKEDMQVRRQQEANVDAQRIIYAVEQAINQDGHRLSMEERATLEHVLTLLKQQLTLGKSEASVEDLHHLTKALDQASQILAARRMDAAISARLEGKDIDELAS